MQKRIIYALCCPVTDEVHYIGKSTQGLIRPAQHMKESHSEKVREWVGDLAILGHAPKIRVLYNLPDTEDIDSLEEYFVKKHISEGHLLLNHCLVTPLLISETLTENNGSPYDMSDIANFLKVRRKKRGMTQSELADLSGVALTVIRKIEQNDVSKGINIRGLQSLLALFGGKLTVAGNR